MAFLNVLRKMIARRSVKAYTSFPADLRAQNGLLSIPTPIKIKGTPKSGNAHAIAEWLFETPFAAIHVQNTANAVHGMAKITMPQRDATPNCRPGMGWPTHW